jgi:VWFA-related protein
VILFNTSWPHPAGFLIGLILFGYAAAVPSAVHGSEAPAFVTASFTDKRGLFLENLTQEDVQIFENDRPRPIKFMAQAEVPTVYGLVFDLSMLPEKPENDYRGSTPVISKASAARSVSYELIDKYLGRQTLWVGGYAKELVITQDFTSDGFTAKAAIQSMHGKDGPAEPFLYSALFAGVMKMNTRTEKRRVMIVFMDLMDSETAAKLKPIRNLLSSSNVELFVVSFASKLGSGSGGLTSALSQASLRELAQVTSGEAFFMADYRDHFDDVTRRIYNEIRTLYTFGFESGSSADKPARLTIRCSIPGSKVRHHPTIAVVP